jgi:hypothetical protein
MAPSHAGIIPRNCWFSGPRAEQALQETDPALSLTRIRYAYFRAPPRDHSPNTRSFGSFLVLPKLPGETQPLGNGTGSLGRPAD